MARRGSLTHSLVENLKTILYAGLIAIGIRTVAYEPFNIPSASMVPTLLVGDYLFVAKYSYGYSRYSLPFGLPLFSGRIFYNPPRRGDVVVFKLPRDTSQDYIKRIIGLPGDTVQVKNGQLYINGKEVLRNHGRPYDFVGERGGHTIVRHYREHLPGGKTHPILKMEDVGMQNNTQIYHVPPGKVFCMGDNRDDSEDSRFLNAVGYIPIQNLVGRAEIIFFSVNATAPWWEVWRWPFEIRWGRLLRIIN